MAGADCVANPRRIKRLVGYMPDTFGSYDNMRVRRVPRLLRRGLRHLAAAPRVKRIDEVLETAGASTFKDLYVESLSHGMKQRVAIARTLLHDPPVLILDEPANGLDPQARIEMRQLLLDLADRGKTLARHQPHPAGTGAHLPPRRDHHARPAPGVGTLAEIGRQLSQERPMEVLLARRRGRGAGRGDGPPAGRAGQEVIVARRRRRPCVSAPRRRGRTGRAAVEPGGGEAGRGAVPRSADRPGGSVHDAGPGRGRCSRD